MKIIATELRSKHGKSKRNYKDCVVYFDEDSGSWFAEKDGTEVVRYEPNMQSVMKKIDTKDFEGSNMKIIKSVTAPLPVIAAKTKVKKVVAAGQLTFESVINEYKESIEDTNNKIAGYQSLVRINSMLVKCGFTQTSVKPDGFLIHFATYKLDGVPTPKLLLTLEKIFSSVNTSKGFTKDLDLEAKSDVCYSDFQLGGLFGGEVTVANKKGSFTVVLEIQN